MSWRLINTNVATVEIHGADTAAGASLYFQTVAPARSGNGRYHHGHRIVTAFNRRWLRVAYPTQAALFDNGMNYATNPSFEDWLSPTVPAQWTIGGAGATVQQWSSQPAFNTVGFRRS